jgi:N utilization substance protein A
MIPHEACARRPHRCLSRTCIPPRGPQLFLSRTAPQLLIELFKLEVPEGGDNLILIRRRAQSACAPDCRAPGPAHRSIGACVGMRGMRVQSVSNRLAGGSGHHSFLAGPGWFVINAWPRPR